MISPRVFRNGITIFAFSLTCTAVAQSSDGVVSGQPISEIGHQHQSPPQLPETGVSLLPPDVGTLQLAAGMQLRFGVYDTPEMTATLRVAADGSVAVPLAGPVYVAGKTLPEARKAIEAVLIEKQYFTHPEVLLDVTQIAPSYVTITGEVQAPGRFQILAPITLQAAIAQVGGETTDAGATIEIHRAGTPPDLFEHVSNARSEQNHFGSTQIFPGDSLNVNRAGIVYVLGAVHRPGGYLMLNRGALSVLEALALAQGTLLEASTGSIRILHSQGDQVTEEHFQLDPSTKGRTSPLLLHDTDIVYVPVSKPKSFIINGASIIGAATSSIIYRVY